MILTVAEEKTWSLYFMLSVRMGNTGICSNNIVLRCVCVISNYKELLYKQYFHLQFGCRYEIEAINLGLINRCFRRTVLLLPVTDKQCLKNA